MIDGTVSIVVGATSGIGREIALALAANGSNVTLIGRRHELLSAAVHAAGARATAIRADVRDRSQVKQAIDQVHANHNRIDIFVYCAGVMSLGLLENEPAAYVEEMIQTNVMGFVNCFQHVIPHLVRSAGQSTRAVADVLCLSSIAASRPLANRAVYGATKSALSTLCEALRQENASRDVRICSVEPGAVGTDLAASISLQARSSMAGLFDSSNLLDSSDVAEIVLHTLSRPPTVSVSNVVVRHTRQIR